MRLAKVTNTDSNPESTIKPSCVSRVRADSPTTQSLDHHKLCLLRNQYLGYHIWQGTVTI